jgi:hypothetical protein
MLEAPPVSPARSWSDWRAEILLDGTPIPVLWAMIRVVSLPATAIHKGS